MRPSRFQLALYLAAVLPVVLVAASSSVWWDVLARPWAFVAVGTGVLYVLLGAFVVALVFIGPGFGGYFLDAPSPSNASYRASFPIIETAAAVIYIILGVGILWTLKQWLLRP